MAIGAALVGRMRSAWHPGRELLEQTRIYLRGQIFQKPGLPPVKAGLGIFGSRIDGGWRVETLADHLTAVLQRAVRPQTWPYRETVPRFARTPLPLFDNTKLEILTKIQDGSACCNKDVARR
jgi:hypothetical protein